MPSSSATAAACTAPAPPNGSSVKAGKIDAALGGKHAHLVGHAHVDDALDAGGGRQHIHLQRIGDMRS